MRITRKKKKALIILLFVLFAGVVGTSFVVEYIRSQKRIILATTTSTYDSGLLDYLLPTYEAKSGLNIQVLSVGTGQAIEIAKRGDADVLLVHSRFREDAFVEEGYGVHRACIMYNDFIVVGPASDPANIKGKNVKTAMFNLKNAGAAGEIKFYSRGDKSGTHSKELLLWAEIKFVPNTAIHSWYLETGSGMGNTLTITDQNDGYTIVDRGTWLSAKNNLDLELLVEGYEIMLNPYGVIAVNPEKNPHAKFDWAMNFISWLTSEEAQGLIANFTINDELLFKPAFGRCHKTHSCSTTHEEVRYWSKYNGGYTGDYVLPSVVA